MRGLSARPSLGKNCLHGGWGRDGGGGKGYGDRRMCNVCATEDPISARRRGSSEPRSPLLPPVSPPEGEGEGGLVRWSCRRGYIIPEGTRSQTRPKIFLFTRTWLGCREAKSAFRRGGNCVVAAGHRCRCAATGTGIGRARSVAAAAESRSRDFLGPSPGALEDRGRGVHACAHTL